MPTRVRVLFLCTGNSARSQMAEGLLRQRAGERFEAHSAGTHPGAVRPEAVQVMREIGIDISGQRSKSVREFAGQRFDFVITVCDHAARTCPSFAGAVQRLHWSIPDPGGLDDFPATRDRLSAEIESFLEATAK